MTTRLPPHPSSSMSQNSGQTRPPSLPVFSGVPKSSLRNNHRPSPWDSIDPRTIEIVDLTGTSSHPPPRRPLASPTSERPSKRAKGKDPEVHISLDDDEQNNNNNNIESPQNVDIRHKSPSSQSGSLSQAKCVICLDSPTDLAATPCGIPPTFPWTLLTFRTPVLRFLYS
jgi:hypothetical protein